VRIAFFGCNGSFDFGQIGGTDSFFRRIGIELVARGCHVEFVHYGGDRTWTPAVNGNIRLSRFRTFNEALAYLRYFDGSILVNAVKAADRLRFIQFRRQVRQRARFWMVYSLFSATPLRRFKHFLEAAIYPYRPGCICMSERLAELARKYRNDAHVLLPPVPLEYYRTPCQKRSDGTIVVAYIGRLEQAKGIEEVITILETLAPRNGFQARVLAYAFDNDTAAEQFHNRLAANQKIHYRRFQHKGWSPALEHLLARELSDIDVLLLPYRSLSCSIDIPLLLLEGMASLCCCATRPLADIPKVYGDSPFLLPEQDPGLFASSLCRLIEDGGLALIEAERKRLALQTDTLRFDTQSVTTSLLHILQKDQ
jgi:glycosyltransferase involved in cell wall biosynthesis